VVETFTRHNSLSVVHNQHFLNEVQRIAVAQMFADNVDQLVRITKVLGTDTLYMYIDRYNIDLETPIERALDRCAPKPWHRFITADCEHLCDSDALDLVEKMLVMDHAQRIMPRECFDHPYFKALLDGTIKDPNAKTTSSTTGSGGGFLNK
jgi:serine/threonine protein kinase